MGFPNRFVAICFGGHKFLILDTCNVCNLKFYCTESVGSWDAKGKISGRYPSYHFLHTFSTDIISESLRYTCAILIFMTKGSTYST